MCLCCITYINQVFRDNCCGYWHISNNISKRFAPDKMYHDLYFGSIVYHLYFTDNNVMFANANTFTLTYTNHVRKELLIVDCLRGNVGWRLSRSILFTAWRNIVVILQKYARYQYSNVAHSHTHQQIAGRQPVLNSSMIRVGHCGPTVYN
jgi:hypothetical protein